MTWGSLRQLCTVYGQTYGAPAELADGTVLTVAAHSHAANDWRAVLGHTHLLAIRWQPLRD